ncbi:MAG: hypothetical protein KatS3mg121_1404 [Gammaproteobacteria bacterium]|nr:MAG: hypothetical protein KatS3mg121_1404 [Gammaproteobacteria bacterium]
MRHIELESADRLEGLPQDYIDRHPPGPDGRIRITTDYPDYFPFMQYAADDAARLALYKAFMNRGWPANREVLAQILAKRHALARLLGYPSYAHLVTEDKMIRSPERAQAFINKVNTLAMARAEQDYRILLERLRRIDPGATAVGDWQKMYLEEQVKRERYGLDAQVLRPYFAYARVRDGIFRLVEDLFAVEIRPWTPGPEDPPLWHPSVTAWEVVDGGRVLGRFYLDMHPREGKYKHAAHFTIQTGVAGRRLPMAALVCNFPDPEAGPAYLEHREVETFLHEFGHLLHGIFAGHQRWVAQSGIATEWDFVEAPSQLLEEWIWDAESLRRFAVDDAGRPIPDALVERMNAARRFGRGLFARHQMFYAALSLNYHNRDPAQIDLDGLMIRLRAQYSPFPHVPGTHFYASFGHLVGYSALYYTYMWSLAIAQDMLSVFRDNGMLDRATALRYRKTVLEPGGSRDAEALVQDFLGRPFDFAAFAAWLNRED